ncbi:MAG: DUF2147 domain-containing protein [Terracidiphilus sp.]
MGKTLTLVCAALLLLAAGGPNSAAQGTATPPAPATTPVGHWKTIDDATGKEKSVVVLWMQDGQLFGRVEKILDPDPGNPEEKCLKCSGDLKNKPIAGLQILWGLHPNSADAKGAEWAGGFILDPHSGTSYKCLIALEDNGRKLKVRGFIGFSLLGRTQYWYRVD